MRFGATTKPRQKQRSTGLPRRPRGQVSRLSRGCSARVLTTREIQFSRIARRFDLAIVGQTEPDRSAIEAIISESTLFESGRPMIVVPYIQKDAIEA